MKERVNEEKEVLSTILNDDKICLQNAKQDIQKQDMITGLTSTVNRFQYADYVLIAEKKSLFQDIPEPMTILDQSPHGTPSVIQKRPIIPLK